MRRQVKAAEYQFYLRCCIQMKKKVQQQNLYYQYFGLRTHCAAITKLTLRKKKSAETRFKFRITIATERREGKTTRLLSQIIRSSNP